MERVSWRVLLSSHALSLGAYRRGRSKQSLPSLNAARCCQVIDCGGERTGARKTWDPLIRSLAPTKAPVASPSLSHTNTNSSHTRHAESRLLPDPISATCHVGVLSNVDGNNFGEWTGCDQWSAGTTPEMGRRRHFHSPRDGLARYGDREHRSARNSSRSSCQPIRSHLGSECLPDCDGRNPFAARRAWRGRRSPPDLPRRPSAVHVGVAFLCIRMVVAQPVDGARAAGPRRRWHHEREYGLGSLRLSRALAGTGFRTQCDGRRDRLYPRPDDRLGHSRDWTVDLAVCHQHSLRHRCDLDRFEDIAAYPESGACFRFYRRADGC